MYGKVSQCMVGHPNIWHGIPLYGQAYRCMARYLKDCLDSQIAWNILVTVSTSINALRSRQRIRWLGIRDLLIRTKKCGVKFPQRFQIATTNATTAQYPSTAHLDISENSNQGEVVLLKICIAMYALVQGPCGL